jgi:hypothetical protein
VFCGWGEDILLSEQDGRGDTGVVEGVLTVLLILTESGAGRVAT